MMDIHKSQHHIFHNLNHQDIQTLGHQEHNKVYLDFQNKVSNHLVVPVDLVDLVDLVVPEELEDVLDYILLSSGNLVSYYHKEDNYLLQNYNHIYLGMTNYIQRH
jgi:hypothetical protein